jgi:hypothetical protein
MAGKASSAARKRALRHWQDRRRKSAREGWVQPYKRATFALKAAYFLLRSTMHVAASCEQQAQHHPIAASKRLWKAMKTLWKVGERLDTARYRLTVTYASMALADDLWEQAPEALRTAFAQFMNLAAWMEAASKEITATHVALLEKLASGELEPEQPTPRPRRIAVAPRVSFVRAFLAARRRRAIADRINPVLRRRRRTPRPAGLRVPRRSVLGRAPPLSSLCAL